MVFRLKWAADSDQAEVMTFAVAIATNTIELPIAVSEAALDWGVEVAATEGGWHVLDQQRNLVQRWLAIQGPFAVEGARIVDGLQLV